MSFASTFVEIRGCRTHLRRAGKGEPLLFLHGASGAPAIMPFMEKLAQRFDVLVTEHPGYGQSEEPEWLENIHDVAYFYLDFLKQLDLKNVTLVGSSMGGWMAMEIAVRDTRRLKSLVLVSPAGVAVPGVQPADIFLLPPEDMVRALFSTRSWRRSGSRSRWTWTWRSRTATPRHASPGSRGCTIPSCRSGCTVSTCR